MAVQSIRAAIQIRNMAGNHFLGAPRKMSFGKMDGIGKINDLPQEIRPCPKTLNDAGNLLATGTGSPVVIRGGSLSRGFVVFNNSNFRFHMQGYAYSDRPTALRIVRERAGQSAPRPIPAGLLWDCALPKVPATTLRAARKRTE